jgi:hypothetical protein
MKFFLRSAVILPGLFLASDEARAVGTWTQMTNGAPNPLAVGLLLSDGTVMAQSYPGGSTYSANWYRLAPDTNGSYLHGSWTNTAPMNYTRLYCSSQVLRDGRVFVAGGEYGTGGATAEIYDPISNIWTPVTVPTGWLNTNNPGDGANGAFRDSGSMLLPDGSVLIAPVYVATNFNTFIYNPRSNSWSSGGTSLGSQNEASWVKLPDDSILTINKDSTSSERYIPGLGRWIADANLPSTVWSNSEIGPALLLPDGRAFFLGGNGRTALYTPSGDTNVGSWVMGTNIPGGNLAFDAPGAMIANGEALCAVANGVSWSFYEFDWRSNSFTFVPAPAGATSNAFWMLDLPDGTVLCEDYQNGLFVYHPAAPQLPSGKPSISQITWNADGSLHLIGTLLNGVFAGGAYGDDAQMDSNYPLVRLTNDVSHVVYYARTYNWSSTSVQTGSKPVSTEFTLPQAILNGGPASYSLVVVANGIASDPITFSGPVWVDFNYAGVTQNGSFAFPYRTVTNGIAACPVDGRIICKGPANHRETPRITKALTIAASGGAVTVGR